MQTADRLKKLNEMHDKGYFEIWQDFLEDSRQSCISRLTYPWDDMEKHNEKVYTKHDVMRLIVYLIDGLKDHPIDILAEMQGVITQEELHEFKNNLTSQDKFFNKIKEVLGIDAEIVSE